MAAESQEDASLVKYAPHFAGNIFLHVLPPIGARIVVVIVLRFEISTM
jgi:hypothetical protein